MPEHTLLLASKDMPLADEGERTDVTTADCSCGGWSYWVREQPKHRAEVIEVMRNIHAIHMRRVTTGVEHAAA